MHVETALAILLATASFLIPPTVAQGDEHLGTFFLPDSEPRSLEASVISIVSVSGDPVTSLQVACPTARSPENDACREAGIYPAQVYHTQGSVWGGTTTYSVDDSTTTWGCALGGGLGAKEGIRATCSKTIERGGSIQTESTSYGNCYCIAHLLPMVVTANADLLHDEPFTPYTGKDGVVTVIDASWLDARYSQELSSSGCPASETTMWAGATAAATTTTVNPGSSPTTPTSSTETSTSAENAGIKGIRGLSSSTWLVLVLPCLPWILV